MCCSIEKLVNHLFVQSGVQLGMKLKQSKQKKTIETIETTTVIINKPILDKEGKLINQRDNLMIAVQMKMRMTKRDGQLQYSQQLSQ